jgi:peptidoglycan hydrolase-like protein with peptidoglycan-binding domain
MTGIRGRSGLRVGFGSAAAAVVLGLTLSACGGSTPQPVSALDSPAPGAASTATATGTVAPAPAGPVPTVRADPLTPTEPTPSESAATATVAAPVATTSAPAATPTPTTPAAVPVTTPPATPTTADPGSVAGSCRRTLPAYPVLEPGAKGPAVSALQCFLDDADYGPLVVDGVYGPQTRAAVRRLEAGYEGPAPHPGRIDAGTWVLLISRSLGDERLQVGSTGSDVVTLQRALRAAGGTITVDGTFGAETKKVVRRFQQANRVGDDGVVGEETLFLLKMGATIG